MKTVLTAVVTLAASLATAPLMAAPAVGQPAPDFKLTDSNGQARSLSDFKGKTVVLEWTNPGCPFVQKHYDSANIPGQQKTSTGKDVVWLSINSSAKGQQGDVDAATANKGLANWKAAQTAYLFDRDGKVGHLYAARTTPNLYVIDGQGVLRYMGAIDSIASANPADIAKATQYVPTALAEMAAGKPVSKAVTQPYGCSVKYSDG
ncbi:thioredoxin family protein [soil metagenome]